MLPAIWLAGAFLLEAMARDALSDQDAVGRALERALDLAERDGALLWFLLCPVRSLLERQARDGTMHSALVAGILDLLAGTRPTPAPEGPRPPDEPLSKAELRVLRYLPTHLSAPEMARELFVSPNTVRTHIKSLYAKLGTHHRAETVELARALGLLAPSRTARATARPKLTPSPHPDESEAGLLSHDGNHLIEVTAAHSAQGQADSEDRND